MPNSANNTLPTITSVSDLTRVLKKWQTQLNPLLKVPKTPHAPWNFAATRQRGGILLSWAAGAQTDVDGYIILRSDNGDFANPVTIPIQSAKQNSYFDPLGGTTGGTAAITKWYRIRATNGTVQNPQSILGILSGAVTTTSIDPTDTVTPATTTRDITTSDTTQSSAGRGRIIEKLSRTD
jgi:hypothetical protein